jgi:hypothetical protein
MNTAFISGTIRQVTEDWYAWFFERAPAETAITTAVAEITGTGTALYQIAGQEAESEFAEVLAVGTANVQVSGQSVDSELGTLTPTGTANILLSGQSVDSEVGTVQTEATANIEVTGVLATSEIQSVTVSGNAQSLLNGIEITSQTGDLAFVVDSVASVQAATANTFAGFVSATGDKEMTMVPGRISYQLPKKNAIVKINGVSLSSNIENVTASGTIVINAKAKIYSIEAKLKASDVKARGVWDIEENDLILLLAA